MEKRNEMPNRAYWFTAVVVVAATAYVVKPVSFNVPNKYIPFILLAAGTAIFTELGVFIKKYKRDSTKLFELYQTCIIPAFVYIYVRDSSLDKTLKGLLIILLAGAVYIGILFKINIIDSGKKDKKKYVHKVIASGLYNIRIALIFLLLVQLMLVELINPAITRHRIDAQEMKIWSEERTLTANYDSLKVLADEDAFDEISDINTRLELFSKVVDVESNYLGIPYELAVKKDNLPRNTLAEYRDTGKIIAVDEDYLSTCNVEDLIQTAAHECRHAWQYQLCRLYDQAEDDEASLVFVENMFEHVGDYRKEITAYKSADYEEYAEQECEKDSRRYAAESYERWMNRMKELEAA